MGAYSGCPRRLSGGKHWIRVELSSSREMVIVLALVIAIWPKLAIKMNAEGEPRIAEKDGNLLFKYGRRLELNLG